MASIVQRGDSLYIHYSVDGVLFRKPLKLKVSKENKRLAENKRYEIEDMILNNIMPTDADLKIERVTTQKNIDGLNALHNRTAKLDFQVNLYFESMPNTINRKVAECAYAKFKEVINTTEMDVNQVSEIAGNTYKEYLLEKLSYNSSRTYLNYMNILFGSFIKRKIYTDENPFKRLKRKDSKFITTIKDEHMTLILDYLKKNNVELYRFINFLRLTGFRLNEALQLNWEQIKWKEKVISMTTFKDNNRNDIFPLEIEHGELRKFLLTFKQENGKMFKLNREYILKPFQKAIVAINKVQKEKNKKWIDIPRYTIHEIRKTFGSKYASKLKPISLMKLMRHANIETTLRYYIQLDVVDIAKELNGL